MLVKKLGLLKLIATSSALALIGTLTFVSQGCTVITSDGVLDGGGFTGNDGALPDTGPKFNSCNECLFQGCTGQWAVCQNSAECMAIYTCATATACAADQTCVNACFDAHPTGQNAYYALASCDFYGQCNACATTCGGAPASCPSQPPADAGSDGDIDAGTAPDAAPPFDGGSVVSCSDCTSSKCSAQKSACANGTACDKYTQCLAACADVACIDKCGTDNADGKNASAALSSCVSASCSTECGLTQ